MQSRGFEETQDDYAADPHRLIGTYHRIGHYGPAYEVVAIKSDKLAKIALLETGEEVDYSIEDILGDPHPDEEPPPLP